MSRESRTLKVGEQLTLRFDFLPDLEFPWRANYRYSVGQFITVGSFVYECTNAGKTAAELPEDLTTTIGATQNDGSVEWTCRDYSNSGTDTISSITGVTTSSEVTVDSSAIVDSVYVYVTITAVSIGKTELKCQVATVSGEDPIAAADIVVIA